MPDLYALQLGIIEGDRRRRRALERRSRACELRLLEAQRALHQLGMVGDGDDDDDGGRQGGVDPTGADRGGGEPADAG